MRSLPVIDPARVEFGFDRTVCDCAECRAPCAFIPGYLIPADLDRIHDQLASDVSLWGWAQCHLRASPGAVVAQRGRTFRIPTLVPARRSDGVCTFLTDNGLCAIHAVAPYGCSFFDSHIPHALADQRSLRGLHAILDAWIAGDRYARLWAALAAAGRVAPAPELCRRSLRHASTRPVTEVP